MIGRSKDDWSYLWYMIRHKFFVFKAGVVLDVPLWRLLVHDFSKFRADEWISYRHYFYAKNRAGRTYEQLKQFDVEFRRAWNLHIRRNDHHWEHWVREGIPVEMPEAAVSEMVADWIGAGRAVKGFYDFTGWWEKNESRIKLHPETRMRVVDLLIDFESYLFEKGMHDEDECRTGTGA